MPYYTRWEIGPAGRRDGVKSWDVSNMAKMAVKRATDRAAAARQGGDRVVANNRRATYEYFIEDTIEAGIVLTGSEIKAIREGKVTISEAYVRIENDELWLVGANVSPFANGGYANHRPDRARKLLAHRRS